MSASIMDHVLSVEEVRKQFKAVNEAALHQQAVIHYGERGADQLVIMSREMWEAMLERAQTVVSRPSPYAGFTQALVDGRLGMPVGPAAVLQARRRLRDSGEDSTVSLANMIAAGADASPPSRRRPAAS